MKIGKKWNMTDRKLPGLQRALDDDTMRLVLSSCLRREMDRGKNIFSQVRHQILKYTPGKRCVIEYRLQTNGNQHGPRRVIGKMYRKNRGQIIFEKLWNLWQVANGNGSGTPFGMPQPLAYLPDLGMMLQGAAPGRPLTGFSENDELSVAIRYAAENLAALHALALARGEKRTLDDHIDRYCHPGPQVLIEACPELGPLVEGILNGLAKDESLHNASICPVHGDLNLAQIFITEDRAFFIDFDGFCLSHAALDIGNFLITLKVHFGPKSEELTRIFLESYLSRQPPRTLTGLRTYQALAYLRRAVICCRLQVGADWLGQARQLLEAADTVLRENECELLLR
jgi:hypothetical protein